MKKILLILALVSISHLAKTEESRQRYTLHLTVPANIYCSDGEVVWNVGSGVQFAGRRDLYLRAELWRYEDCIGFIALIREKYSQSQSTELSPIEISLDADVYTSDRTYQQTYRCPRRNRRIDSPEDRTCTKTVRECSISSAFSMEFEGLKFKGSYEHLTRN